MDQINSRIEKVSKLGVGLLTGRSLVHNLWTFLMAEFMNEGCMLQLHLKIMFQPTESQVTPLKAFFSMVFQSIFF